MNDIEIVTAAAPPRYEELLDLINSLWPPEFGRKTDAEKIAEMTSSYDEKMDTVKYLVKNGRIIGMYRYSLWPRHYRDTKTAHTLDVVVLPQYQKSGFGSLLLRDAIDDCRQKGMTLLLSRSFRSNQGSIRLHESLGFTVYSETGDSIVWQYNLA